MSKLPKEHKFVDLSDYGRPVAKLIAQSLESTCFTPIHVTLLFVVSGLIALMFMLFGWYSAAGIFLVLKSILDAADGELARIKDTPSYTGRFLDSISDIILNLLIFSVIVWISDTHPILGFLAFLCMQIQGTLYNYYYTILRSQLEGDVTSRIFENEIPTAFPGEKQIHVTFMYKLYRVLYGSFDKLIYTLDFSAAKGKVLPNWFMTALSIFGLGFQLLLISVLLIAGLKAYVAPIIIGLTVFVPVFVCVRKYLD
jgi:phosphatidylglycerophosphate synthase